MSFLINIWEPGSKLTLWLYIYFFEKQVKSLYCKNGSFYRTLCCKYFLSISAHSNKDFS